MFMSQVGFGQNSEEFFEPAGRAKYAGGSLSRRPRAALVSIDELQSPGEDRVHRSRGFKRGPYLVLLEAAYSLTTAVMVRLDYVHDINVTSTMAMMGMPADDRLYLTVNFYD